MSNIIMEMNNNSVPRDISLMTNSEYKDCYESRKDEIPQWYHEVRLEFFHIEKTYSEDFPRSEEEAKMDDNLYLMWLVSEDCVKAADWLHAMYPYTKGDFDEVGDIDELLDWISQNSGEKGLEGLKWFHKTFGFSESDIKQADIYMFSACVMEGKLETLKWIQATFPHTKEEICNEDFDAFEEAKDCGHSDILEWLIKTF